MSNPPSVLPVSKYCGLAGKLYRQYGNSTSAKMSQAFHALIAEEPSAQRLLLSLSPEDKASIFGWKKPTPVEIDTPNGVIRLDYPSAQKEVRLAARADGSACDYDDPDHFVRGRADMVWVREMQNGTVVYIGDIKRSCHTTLDPENLQNKCYAHLAVTKHYAVEYWTGLWYAEEGYWSWSGSNPVGPFDLAMLWKELCVAITNESTTGTTGSHCRECYQRLRCPEHALPLASVDTWLTPLVQAMETFDVATMADGDLLSLLLKVQAVQDYVKSDGPLMSALKDIASRRGGIRDETTGKVWQGTVCQGKESVSASRLRQMLGEEASQYIARGKPYSRMMWRKQS